MNESSYDIAFKLIANAGDSKSESLMAIEAAREFNFEEANSHLEIATEKLSEAHKIQSSLIQNEARGNKVDVNIILVHAQDHLSGAILMKDQADEFIKLYEIINKLIKGEV